MMRVTVLHAPATGGVGAIVRYLTESHLPDTVLGPGAYYTDTVEPPGRWWGSGLGAVGLEVGSEVDPVGFGWMLDGRHPGSGAKLGRAFGATSARGYDATFSAPKSVSLLWALADDEQVRAETVAAHEAAVDATLGWLERHGSVTRRGTDGVFQVDAQGLAVARFRQYTSRALDPQLHTHAVVWNKVQDRSGRWLALDARFLLQQQFTMSWIYGAALRAELTERLGVEWDDLVDGHGQADMTCVPAGLREVFSQRSRHVAAKKADLVRRWMDEHDGAEPDVYELSELERRAALASRPNKTGEPENLEVEWRRRAADAGYGAPAVRQPSATREPVLDREAVIRRAIAQASERSAEWIEADLAREIAAQLPATIGDAAEVIDLVDELAAEAASRCVELHPPAEVGTPTRLDGRPVTEHVTKRRLSAPPVLAQEARLLDFADATLEAAPDVDPDDRQNAVAEAIAGRGRLVLVVGPAGAGKTTAVAEGARRLKEQRRLLVGLAPSGKAADVLAEATGAKCVTLAKLLHNDRTGASLPPRDTTIVLDEAGMASTDDLDHLVALTQRHAWRLVAIGDPEQLPAVGRGGMFAHWTDTLSAHRLEHIHRFSEPWQASASLRLRRGDPTAAAEYVERDRARTVHPDVVSHHAARLHRRAVEQGQRLAITTGSAETARRINEEIQALIHADDERRDEHDRLTRPLIHRLTHRLADGTEVGVGDQIATRRNARLETDRGVPVRNRHVWTVVRIGRNGSLTVAHDERGTVTLPGSYVAEAVELGWAVTGYGIQGDTTDHSLTVIEPGMSRAGIYVGLTRGRGTNLALITDPTGTADPEDALARAIARPANAKTAHATRDELWIEQGFDPPRRTLAEHRVERAQVEIEPIRRTAPTLGL